MVLNNNKRYNGLITALLLAVLVCGHAIAQPLSDLSSSQSVLQGKINKVSNYQNLLETKLKSAGSKSQIIKLREMSRQNQMRLNSLQAELDALQQEPESKQPVDKPIRPTVNSSFSSPLMIGAGFGNIAGGSGIILDGELRFDSFSSARLSLASVTADDSAGTRRTHTVIFADYIYDLDFLVENFGLKQWFPEFRVYEGIGLNYDANISDVGTGGIGGQLFFGIDYPLFNKWGNAYLEAGYTFLKGGPSTYKGVTALFGVRSSFF